MIRNGSWLKGAIRSRRWFSFFDSASRASFAGTLLFSSIYCLLAYIPSTYYAFIQAPFLSWMPLFARIQPYLFIITFGGTALLLKNPFHNG
ncbi:MAG TPA: hypothetical protein VE133_14030, partial [Candidatus Sulfotelmatobacter sp.]|nr:hypothetical protein [Candidatus Sulfotelmatobacter sp.]